MRIILLGPPGTGKGTQGKFIIKKYNIPHISTGDILRENISSGSIIGEKIKNTMIQGKLVDNNIICDLITKRIQKKDCDNGFLLDGFPRNIEQAQYLSRKKINIDYILELLIPYKLILERISGRRIHLNSGRIYHIKFNPPKEKNIDDFTGEKLCIREDDKIEIVKKRLKEYIQLSQPLTQYYQEKKIQDNLKYFQLNGANTLSEVKKNIDFILKNSYF
ncbi:adenylate kinase [Buchnera aphidicola]|uniref:adenylate kinase n=1 Tax=Buchnera aphidicola TaxID=9 RepID=UPI003BEF43A0